MNQALVLPRPDNVTVRRDIAGKFVNLSQAVRDFTIDLAVSRFEPEDVRALRNLIQGVLRAIMAIRPNTKLFDIAHNPSCNHVPGGESITNANSSDGNHLDVKRVPSSAEAMHLITTVLTGPTSALIKWMNEAVSGADALLLKISGHSEYTSRNKLTLTDPEVLLKQLRAKMTEFDEADISLIEHPNLPSTYSNHPEVVELFLFVHPVRQAADRIEAFLVKVMEIHRKARGLRVLLPSYPLRKLLFRTNAQVRHDRGGLTAGAYFRTKGQLERIMRASQSTAYIPMSGHQLTENLDDSDRPHDGKYEDQHQPSSEIDQSQSENSAVRRRIWMLLHRLQGFESRFAFKVALVTALLSIPA